LAFAPARIVAETAAFRKGATAATPKTGRHHANFCKYSQYLAKQAGLRDYRLIPLFPVL
jgi:hypothetical protein